MTFDPSIPNPSQSPGLFPTQNATNYARLKTIINADHLFNDTAQSTDGFHRQMTMIDRAIPVAPLPTGANGILYSYLDANSQSQMAFFNGTTNYTLTPNDSAPAVTKGIVTALASNTPSGTIYTIPTNTFITVFVNYTNANPTMQALYKYYLYYNSGATFTNGGEIKNSGGPTPVAFQPSIVVSGQDFAVQNNYPASADVGYYIIAVSIP